MGYNSGIEWTHTIAARTPDLEKRAANVKGAVIEESRIVLPGFTFNPWWGCDEVSPACDHCYARMLDARWHPDDPHWGPGSTRLAPAPAYWLQPAKWNKLAESLGVVLKVFCASMADIFETHDSLVVQMGRQRLWPIIEETPWLDWLLLTKRPHNMTRAGFVPVTWTKYGWPENVVAMCTVEDQQWADIRIPQLQEVPASRRGLSMEPLVGEVDIRRYLGKWPHEEGGYIRGIDWIITGGESGKVNEARPAHPDWYRSLRDQALEADVPFHMKQWGNWVPVNWFTSRATEEAMKSDDKRRVWPDGRVSEDFHLTDDTKGVLVAHIHKKKAGRMLDGRTWDDYPSRESVGIS